MFWLLAVLLPLTNATDIASDVRTGTGKTPFSLCATVSFVNPIGERSVAVVDDSGAAIILLGHDMTQVPTPSVGDTVRLEGETMTTFPRIRVALCARSQTIRPGPPLPPTDVKPADFLSGRFDNRLIRLHGVVTDSFTDEISRGWHYLVLLCDGMMVYAAYPEPKSHQEPIAYGSEITVTGVCDPANLGLRRLLGRILVFNGIADLTTINPPPSDPFDAPPLDNSHAATPSEIVARGRVKANGHVLAVWNKKNLLLKTPSDDIVNVELSDPPAPRAGQEIEVVGHTETDLYRVNLSHAVWRVSRNPTPSQPEDDRNVMTTSVSDIMANKRGDRELQPGFHGSLIRLQGVIRHVSELENGDCRIHLETGNEIVPVEIPASAANGADLDPGTTAELTGICVIETENWRPGSSFPRTRGMSLVLRDRNDIRILARPPWWTPTRLLVAFSVLVLTIAVLFGWNRILRLLVTRRSRELLREQVAKLESELRISERTRLAAELHDNLAQNLTAITYQVSAAHRARQRDPAASENHLTTAARMLDSCRTELRRCLWDLRSEALDEKDFSQAIRLSVTPVLANASVAIRFNVPRSRLRDSTAQSVLSMLRELVSNAVRHGQASQIRIAGELNDGSLRFSIRDNGCGFDPGRCGTASDGHFGLDGIRERVSRHGGRVEIASTRGMGTRILVSLPLHQPAPTDEKTK